MTGRQQLVLDELRVIARRNAFRYRENQKYLHERDLEKLARGDESCVFGMGGLTYQVAHSLGMTTGSVLAIFKALERKALVIRETSFPEYKRPLYWWPVSMAPELLAEIQGLPQ